MTFGIGLMMLACSGGTLVLDETGGTEDTGTEDTGTKDTGTKDTGTEALERFSGEYELYDAPGIIRGQDSSVPLGSYVTRGGADADGTHALWVNDAQWGVAYGWENGVEGEQTPQDADVAVADPNGETYSYFGYSSVADQDLDGDGQADLALVAPGVGGMSHISVFSGPPEASQSPVATILGPKQGFGWSLTAVQYEEPHLVVGSPGGEGVYLFASPIGTVLQADYAAHLSNPAGWDDLEVDRAGDLDGDGIDDLVVSSRDRVYLLNGPLSGEIDLDDADGIVKTLVPNAQLTAIGRGAGDIDGDGRDDLLIGSPYSAGSRGSAGVLMGPVAGESNLADAAVQIEYSKTSMGFLGYSVDAAGDVDADGHGDVIVGAPSYGTGGGEAFLWYGPMVAGTYASDDADARFHSVRDGGGFGTQVLGLGDTNGDGGSDLLIAAPFLQKTGAESLGGVIGVWSL